MKIFYLIVLFALAGVWTLRAQTNTNAVDEILALVTTNAPVPKPQPARQPTRIESDSVDFDLTAHRAIYHGHVRVEDPEMKLNCEWLTADLPQEGGRINHIVAETNVVADFTDEKGQTMHATGDKAVYVYDMQNGVTNETVTLTGNPELENSQGKSTGDVIVWNRARNHLDITNPKIVFRQNINGAMAGTNSPVVETNLPPVATNQMTAPK
ncbi:MAG: LptA/OstA family protein [Verrucomicrobiota bacterium]